MRLAMMLLLAAVCLAVPASAQARGGRLRAQRYEPYHQQQLAPPALGGPRSAAYWRGQYPQYYGGFHARHLQNIGIPTGDIGIRGNSITVNPW